MNVHVALYLGIIDKTVEVHCYSPFQLHLNHSIMILVFKNALTLPLKRYVMQGETKQKHTCIDCGAGQVDSYT